MADLITYLAGEVLPYAAAEERTIYPAAAAHGGLADTDAGSLITASQSGAQWGYQMIAPQVILMPILYVVQEITVRLGIVTGRGTGR